MACGWRGVVGVPLHRSKATDSLTELLGGSTADALEVGLIMSVTSSVCVAGVQAVGCFALTDPGAHPRCVYT